MSRSPKPSSLPTTPKTDPLPHESVAYLHIVGVEAENVKRLKMVRVDVDPSGGLVIVEGDNENGKTSFMDSIAMALGGAKLICDKPIRDGQKTARAEVRLGDAAGTMYIVTRTWTKNGTSLKIEKPDGGQIASPQGVLDQMLGDLTFDVTAFERMKPKERAEVLKATVPGLADKCQLFEAARASAEINRRDANRDLAGLETRLKAMPTLPEGTEQETSAVEIANRLAAANETNRKNDQDRQWLLDANAEVTRQDRAIAKMEQDLEAARSLRDQLAEVVRTNAPIIAAKKDTDIAPIQEALRTVEEANNLARKRRDRRVLAEEVKTKQKQVDASDEAVKDATEGKAKLLLTAKLPVPGLTLTDEDVLVDGIPFSQLAASRRLITSAQIGIAQNPKIRIARVLDGSLLDGQRMKELAEWAKANNVQVWVERVGSGNPGAIHIEDGRIA